MISGQLASIIWSVSNSWAWAGVILLCIACVVAVIWVYHPGESAARHGWTWLMVALRSAALVAIVLCLLRPSAVRPMRDSEAGGIAILIDQSQSMAALDTAQSPSSQVAVAAALDLLPPDQQRNHLSDLRRQIDQLLPLLEQTQAAQSQWQYAQLTSNRSKLAQRHYHQVLMQLTDAEDALVRAEPTIDWKFPKPNSTDFNDRTKKQIEHWLAELTARQQQQNQALYEANPDVQRICAHLATMNRLDLARAAVANLVKQMPASTPIYGFVFGAHLAPVALRQQDQPDWPAHLTPDAASTDIGGALRQAMHRLRGRRIRAVVVFTDGRQTGHSLMGTQTDSSVPIFPVMTAGPLRDIVLRKVAAPTVVYPLEPAEIKLDIAIKDMPAQSLRLSVDAGATRCTQTLWTGDKSSIQATIPLVLRHPGAHTIHAQVAPADNEASTGNNSIDFNLMVAPTPLKVSLLGSWAGWDFQYLRQILQQAKWIDPAIALLPDQMPLKLSPLQLRQQNVIILDDLSIASLSPLQRQAIRQFVQKDGGTLLLIAGPSNLPADYISDPTLSKILPFPESSPPVWRAWAGQDAFFRFSPSNADWPMLRIGNEPADIQRQWDRLPGMYHYLQIPRLRSNATAMLTERDSASPVMTETRHGAGHVLLVGFNETWRWRADGQSKLQTQFWTRLLRYAAPRSDRMQTVDMTAELNDLSPDVALMSRLAQTSGGQMLTLSDANQLWHKIRQQEQTHPAVVEYALWHSPWLFAFVVGCLGAEWGLRKRFGLA